jgi:soluble lytic murein transglycosylase
MPPPEKRIESGDYALFIGDWDSAMREYIIALETNPDPITESAARMGIGRTQYLQGDISSALNSFRGMVDEYPDSPYLPTAYYFLAQIYGDLQRFEDAASSYESYLQQRPGLIDSYIHEWRGDLLVAGGDFLPAIDAYNASIASDRLSGDERIQIKAAQALASSGDYQSALALYDEIFTNSSSDFTRAEINYNRGEILLLLGDNQQAYSYFQESVDNYPRSYSTYLGLITLVENDVPVSELNRGVVDYFAGQYSLAVGAFDRYLINEETHDATAHFYKGLSLRAIDSPESAINEWDEIIEGHGISDPYWDRAIEEKGYTQWAFLGNYEAALQTFLNLVSLVPDHPRAGEFLFFSAQVSERDQQLERAVELWERVEMEYPSHFLASRSRFLAGITSYRLGDYSQAQLNFQRALETAGNLEEQVAATLWIGKTEAALGLPDAARVSWQQAASMDPTGYYSERALDLLADRLPFTPPQNHDFAIDWEFERKEAEGWMRVIFDIQDSLDLSTPGDLGNDPRFLRGTELWHLGRYELARAEFEDLRASIQSDPVKNFRLANYLMDLGLYRTAIFCARQVLNLAGMDDATTLSAPIYFNHIRFGLYYKDLINQKSQEYGIHPLLLFSLIRQESLFEGFVRSSAGARGLMQIIPSTGEGIFNNLGWPPNYTSEDLYRPVINIAFGTDYLSDQLAFLDGDMYAALAAYNGGPGNASVWQSLVPEDPDLFLEVVRFEETRRYIRGIYEIFAIYRRIYDRTP